VVTRVRAIVGYVWLEKRRHNKSRGSHAFHSRSSESEDSKGGDAYARG
jgi:hypothetical protein